MINISKMDKRDVLHYEEPDPFCALDSLRHQEVTPNLVANLLFKFCDPKNHFVDENIVKLANFTVEKLIRESPLSEILQYFDGAEFNKKFFKTSFDYNRFYQFCRILCASDKQGNDIFAVAFFSKPWKNNAYFQLEFIKFCIRYNHVHTILSSCHNNSFQLNKLVPQIELLKCQPDYESDTQLGSWKFQCLYQILVDLSEVPVLFQLVEEIFFIPLNKCPDLLVLGLLECYGSMSRLKEMVLIKAILKFLYPTSAHPNATQIFQKIWPSDFNQNSANLMTSEQRILLTSMIELYSSSTPDDQQQKLSRILDLSQDLKALNLLLSSNSHAFVIDLACLASRREYLKLDKWLKDKVSSNGEPFVEACLAYVRRRCPAFGSLESSSMSFINDTTFQTILNCLSQFVSDPPKNALDFEIVKTCSKYSQWQQQQQQSSFNSTAYLSGPAKPNQFDSNLMNVNLPPINDGQMMSQLRTAVPNSQSNMVNNQHNQMFFQELEQEFTKEIEEEADSYFQKIYNQDQPDSLSIDNVLEMLKNFQDSQSKREKDVFLCMIRNLFKEYPFLNQYPEKELVITGEIFGGLILYDFVKGYAFVGALRYVLESLKKSPNSRYFTFGHAALNKFKVRLKEFPQFCQHLYNIPHFREFPQNLIEYIEFGKQSSEPPTSSSNGIAFGNTVMFNAKKGQSNAATLSKSSSNCDPMVTTQELIPPSTFQDKIAFIINNLSLMNLGKKAEEFKDLIHKEKEQYNQWISHYFVTKRVCLEANYHDVYSSFLAKLAMVDLSKLILQETYRNIKILLRANKETDNFNDRTLLKNLGQWLGLITIGQNKPILSVELDLRNLLVEAYHKGLQQLLYVVPFVAKVVSGCSKSKVFRPPNPWTDHLISILVELHSEEDLKLNLKFEVEVLCKNLELDINAYMGQSTILKNKELFNKIDYQLGSSVSPPLVVTSSPLVTPLPVPLNPPAPSGVSLTEPPPSLVPLVNQTVPSLEMNLAPQTSPGLLVTHATNLHHYNDINISSISNLGNSLLIQPTLHIILMSPALKVVIKGVVEKTVQDWISYVSERCIKIPLVTTETLVKKDFAKDPDLIRLAAQNMLKGLIAGFCLTSSKESLCNRLHSSIVSLLQNKCKNISKEMCESTAGTIVNDNIDLCVCFVQKTCVERGLEELDKKMKIEFDSVTFQSEAAIKAKNNPVLLKQIAVYEDMGRNMPGFYSLAPTNTAAPIDGLKVANLNMLPNEVVPINNHVMDSFVFIYDKLISQLSELIQEFEYLRHNTDAMHQVLEVLRHAKQNPRDQQTALTLIKNVMHGYREVIHSTDGMSDFSVANRVREFYLIILKALTDQRAFNVRFTTSSITRFLMEQWITLNQTFPDELFDDISHSSLINFAYMDSEFSQFLENGQNNGVAVNTILSFLKYYLGKGLSANFFSSTLELLQRIAHKVNQANERHPILADLKAILTLARHNQNNAGSTNAVDAMEPGQVSSDKAEFIIKEWIANYNLPKQSLPQSFSHIVKSMSANGILKNDEIIARFFKMFLEVVVERVYQVFLLASQHPTVSLNEIHTKCYEYIDAFSVLVLLFIKESGNQGNVDQKFQFLNKILNILTQTAIRDQEIRHQEFQPLTYYRILISIFVEFFYSPFNLGMQDLMYHDNFFEACKMHIVRNYCAFLRCLSPIKVPSFSFAWLDFISHRVFIGKCLDNSPQFNSKSWNGYFILLSELLSFQKPMLQNVAELSGSHDALYKGTLKLFLLLLHDFPEFLAEYCYNFCELIPYRAVQLRNIVLSAHPPNSLPIPEPVNPSIKLETIAELSPPASRNLANAPLLEVLLPIKKDLDNYFITRNISFNELRNFVGNFNTEKQFVYHMSHIDALVLYIGQCAVQNIKNLTVNTVANSPFMDILQSLLMAFDSQGRYILINSMTDHLRYPNLETLFFICAFLVFFQDTNETIREQIVRVFLERLIALRPHPWGVVYMMNELVRNPAYKLLDHNFIKCIPKIEKILANLFQGILNQMGYVPNTVNCNDTLIVDSR